MANEIILDTNALILQFKEKLHLEDELQRLLGKYEIIIPSSVIKELEKLSEGNQNAMAALKYAQKFKKIDVEGKGDNSIIDLAERLGCYVLTNDKELIKRLKNKGIKVIRPRNFKRLDFA